MLSIVRPAVALLAFFSMLTGLLYPAAVTGLAQVVFPHRANGSPIRAKGRVVGSELIGQPFDDPKYFWSRPSATSPYPYNGGASTGTNQGPLNPALEQAVAARVEALRKADPGSKARIPADLVTASASGLDPHISPAAAYYQVTRVARARGLDPDDVRQLVEEHIEDRTLGILGEARINVLLLNRALDAWNAQRNDAREH